MKTKRSSL